MMYNIGLDQVYTKILWERKHFKNNGGLYLKFARRGYRFPPIYLQNRTCKKFKTGEILIQTTVHSCCKIRFQLGKLVQKKVLESEKSRFRALEI